MGRRTLLLVAALLIAALGSTMVFLYARSADARAREGLEIREVLVAQVEVPQGTPVETAEANLAFSLEERTAESVLPDALSSVDSIRGQVALVPIYPGEQIVPQKFGSPADTSGQLPLTEGNLAMTISLGDPQRVVNFVTPGSQVAVFYTGPNPDDDGQPATRLLLERARVIGVGDSTPVTQTTTTAEGEQTTQVPSALLTFDLPQPQAQKVIFAQNQGAELYLGLVDEASSLAPGQITDSDNLFAP